MSSLEKTVKNTSHVIREYGFSPLGHDRLACLVYRENIASIRVVDKLGMNIEDEGEEGMGHSCLTRFTIRARKVRRAQCDNPKE